LTAVDDDILGHRLKLFIVPAPGKKISKRDIMNIAANIFPRIAYRLRL